MSSQPWRRPLYQHDLFLVPQAFLPCLLDSRSCFAMYLYRMTPMRRYGIHSKGIKMVRLDIHLVQGKGKK